MNKYAIKKEFQWYFLTFQMDFFEFQRQTKIKAINIVQWHRIIDFRDSALYLIAEEIVEKVNSLGNTMHWDLTKIEKVLRENWFCINCL